MIKIKVSTPWSHIDFNTRVPTHANHNYRFYFDGQEEVFDFWIIWGGIKGLKEKAVCPPENVIYLTDEVHEERFFNKYFLNQFAAIITCRTDLPHKLILPTHELNTWMVDRSFDVLSANQNIPKFKNISVICSDQTWLPGHKLRYAFVNKLIGHFKDKLDVFGKGFNPIKDKYDALAPYKYSIAIENSAIQGYFTEKIADCYLTDTMPVYYGCPNIDQYFDSEALLLIDPGDYKKSIEKIEALLEKDPYDLLLPLIRKEKKKYINDYHIFSSLIKILDDKFGVNTKKSKITIRNEVVFKRGHSLNTFIDKLFTSFHIPGMFYFQIHLPQKSKL